MSNDNPFAPPQASVRDVSAQTERFQEVSAMTYKGRIGRLRYLAYGMVAYIAVIAIAFLLGVLSGALHLPSWIATTLPMICYGFFFGMLTIQRSHDMDWSGWMSLLMIIPVVGLIWVFKGGTKGENRFGAPTPPNTTGVKVLAFIFPALGALSIIGVLAAVALPAYQGYTQRAKARQTQTAPAVPAPASLPASEGKTGP